MNLESSSINSFIFTTFKELAKEKPYLGLGPYAEISLKIFNELSEQDLFYTRGVCKEWKQLIEQTDGWRRLHSNKIKSNLLTNNQLANSEANSLNPSPLHWNSFQIAKFLWYNPATIISDSQKVKVNAVAAYLHREGFELKGVPSDGDCFFSAFLGSYTCLSRRIPLLDEHYDKTSYLRQVLSGIVKHTDSKRAEEIIEKGTWVSGLGEGDRLASALSIPIRLVTVNEDHLRCGIYDSLIFPEAGLSEEDRSQEWKNIPQEKRPKEYILIVDLGGHFIYAQKPLKQDKALLSKSKISSDILFSNSLSTDELKNTLETLERHKLLSDEEIKELGQVYTQASKIYLEQNARLLIHSNPVIQYHALQPLPQATLDPQSLASSLRSLYLSQKTLSIFRIEAEQEWEFKVPLEEIYVRLGIIESKERKVRDQALDKHSDHIQDDRIPTSETIYEPKKNIEIERLFEHGRLKRKAAKRIYIQGAAGIGKSTLCHYIAYSWAKEELWQNIFSYLFWIPLRNLTLRKYPADKKYTPGDLIVKEYEGKIDSKVIETCVNNATFREKTLLVLDGYDELSADAQGNTSLARSFKELKELFPHILMTSTPGSCSFDRSCELELLGFDKEGVDRYIDRFFKQVQAEGKKQKLHHLLQTSPQVLSLAQIPINLTLLCCLFNEDPEVFESNQSITMTAIYEQIVNWMYKWFLLRRIDQGHSNQTKEKIFAEKNIRHNPEVDRIATAFEEMADFTMKKNTLYLEKREIDHFRGNAITFKELTDCGLLRIPEEKGYFIHLTFQEFLTASKVANQYLQGENRQACQNFVHNYKFEPRYNLVLRMIAGYLSLSTSRNRRYLSLNPLQSFFDDLFAEPQDLSVMSELNLIANCFEECQDPAQVRQYEGFIELVKDYMINLSLLDLNVEALLRNKNLLNHPKVATSIGRLLSNPKTLKNMLMILLSIIRTGQRVPLEIVRLIGKILKDLDEDPAAKRDAAAALTMIAREGGELAKEAADALIQILKEDDPDAKRAAADALSIVVQQGGKLPKEALDALIQLFKEGDSTVIRSAAHALSVVAQEEGELPTEAVEALIQLLKEGDPDAKRAAADALSVVVQQGGKLPKEALDTLIQILKEDDPDAKISAAKVLEAVVQQGGKLPKEALGALIQLLKEGDPDAKRAAADALSVVVQQGGKLPQEALDTLIQILKEDDPDAKISAAKVLEAVVQQGGKLPKEALGALIQILKGGWT